MDKSFILNAQSPAALAEEYIVKCIWNNVFPAGSELPSERELSERIGITRTTLREVLQRLAREGWLTIQHGKTTKVNHIWESAGPNIIKTLIQLDPSMIPTVIDNVVSLRTRMAEYYIPLAIKHNPEKSAECFNALEQLADNAKSYADFDYVLFRQFTFIAEKPVYGLILNSFKEMYHKCASLFFQNSQARQEALLFYRELHQASLEKNAQRAEKCMLAHRAQSSRLWEQILQNVDELQLTHHN